MKVIINVMLKSAGFRDYNDLGVKINESLSKIQEMLSLNDRDDIFSITTRDIKRIVVTSVALLD